MYSIYDDGRHFSRMFPISEKSLQLLLSLAAESDGTVLETACGTGLISIPLARPGHQVTGIDLSASMLEEAKRAAKAEAVSVRWIEGDMRHFTLDESFSLIFIASNAICHLLDRSDFESFLECVRRHLKPDGRFVISVFVPDPQQLERRSAGELPFATYQHPDGSGDVEVTHTYEYEPDTQIKRITTFHRFPERTERLKGRLDMKMYFPQELDALLRYNGFDIIHKWGDGAGSPFSSDATQQIIVASHRTI